MSILIIIAGITAILVGIINAFKDASAIGLFKKPWWNKGRSWKNKWKLTSYDCAPLPNINRPWYYLWLYKPNYVERFPYSSTILVSITDGWHLLQHIQFGLIFLCISFILFNTVLNILLGAIILRAIFSLAFEIVYKKITNR